MDSIKWGGWMGYC
uniref:Uncharacterized protein n=1 Tax=Arundo donax TaxID=35708 RepID=A0A0A8Z4V6_ARUDO